MESPPVRSLSERVWRALGGADSLHGSVTEVGPEALLPSVYDVTALATATVGAATLAVAELLAHRAGEPLRAVRVDRRAASAAFLGERLFTPQGWERPPIWDPIAGDYLARDGWIRLHTNYRDHRAAVEKVLGPVADRAGVTGAVAGWSATELQDAVVAAGGCAAAMNDRERWLASPAGTATAGEPIVEVAVVGPGQGLAGLAPDEPPLTGVRVLDLTRVIAGPVCTRFLAAYGADVLRIDPPGFAEVPALLPETTAGKHRAALDLRDPAGRTVFEGLLRQADVLVTGLRPGALANLGYHDGRLRAEYPRLVTASLDAYGWSGPWAGRRGFDSLVQMSSGIAAAGSDSTAAGADSTAAAGPSRPVPLPAQALDHGTGYLLAAAVCRALTRVTTTGERTGLRASLIATANLLAGYPTPEGLQIRPPDWSAADTEATRTAWGPARRVPIPGRIIGVETRLPVDAGPLGLHTPRWTA